MDFNEALTIFFQFRKYSKWLTQKKGSENFFYSIFFLSLHASFSHIELENSFSSLWKFAFHAAALLNQFHMQFKHVQLSKAQFWPPAHSGFAVQVHCTSLSIPKFRIQCNVEHIQKYTKKTLQANECELWKSQKNNMKEFELKNIRSHSNVGVVNPERVESFTLFP